MIKKIIGILFIIGSILPILINEYELHEKKIEEIEYIDDFIKEDESPFIAILEIPKIKLKKGLYKIGDKNNNVKYNVEIIKGSKFPDENDGNLILAAHSGNGKNAYFTDLDKIKKEDLIIIYYKNKKYEYIINYIYEVPKVGFIDIYRNHNNTITLITCNEKDKSKQVVYIGKLKSD